MTDRVTDYARAAVAGLVPYCDFNPRPPRGGRQQKCTNFIYGFFMIYKLSRKPTHFIPIIKYFFAHFFKKHDAFPVRKPAGFDVSMNFALKH